MLKLTGLDPRAFLAEHWQQQPLLIRGGLSGFEGWLGRDDILELAGYEQTPSRFVAPEQEVMYGPLALGDDVLAREDWTVLVQSLETVFDEAWDLLDAFSFLPRTSLDDVMVSYAAPGGGVGPHLDLYGVFLVQAQGRRRWRYAAAPVDSLDDDAPLAPWPFEPDHDVEVGPGDILYLPPRVPHDGVALDACITYSVGAAAPRFADVLPELFAFLAMEPERAGVPTEGIYADRLGPDPRARGSLPDALARDTLGRARQLDVGPELVSEFLGRLLTAPKPHTGFLEAEPVEADALADALGQPGTLKLCPASRMLHDGEGVAFLNGEAYALGAEPWAALADARRIPLPLSLSSDEGELLAAWIEAGFFEIITPDT